MKNGVSAKLIMAALILGCMAERPTATAAQTPESLVTKLNRRVPTYTTGPSTLVPALIRLSQQFEIPMGVAWEDSAESRKQLNLTLKQATVGEILKAILKPYPSYQLLVTSQVVRVGPGRSLSDRENFLSVRIEKFQLNNVPVEEASVRLHLLVSKPKGNIQFSIAGSNVSHLTLDLKNRTVADALDALVALSNQKMWLVKFADHLALTSKGFRHTKSVWTDNPIADKDEPVWILLRWGDPLPPLAK